MRNSFKRQMVTIELFGKNKVNKAKERWRRKLERKKKEEEFKRATREKGC
jgi:hypothetical protein